jgi:hypothetical protein
MTKPTIKRVCLECGKNFLAIAHEIKRGGGKVCSRVCYYAYQKRTRPKEDKSWNWKGSKVGKAALHNWVERQLGKPQKCDHCGTTDILKKYEWANKSQKYKRELSDWMRLCTKCHWKYDHKIRIKKWKRSVRKIGWNV